jgi:hypothetical protein
MDPMVMGNQRTEKSEELKLLYYLCIYGDIPPRTSNCVWLVGVYWELVWQKS